MDPGQGEGGSLDHISAPAHLFLLPLFFFKHQQQSLDSDEGPRFTFQ